MVQKYWLLAAAVPLAGCVTESRQETVMLSMPPVASAASTTNDSDDSMGLAAAIALVRQQPWCYRRAGARGQQ
ncbi:hypothetical protein [Vineibacter terrae]|uniref:hypothetical protein n=1 Tax=Vineibacter terrae TaxID=2586908 RepID=UPI002E336D99|nr:hypothetical protein [Vineibacter terrae]HEX2889040.1 hypothetical protein [Vineibacter terrae]